MVVGARRRGIFQFHCLFSPPPPGNYGEMIDALRQKLDLEIRRRAVVVFFCSSFRCGVHTARGTVKFDEIKKFFVIFNCRTCFRMSVNKVRAFELLRDNIKTILSSCPSRVVCTFGIVECHSSSGILKFRLICLLPKEETEKKKTKKPFPLSLTERQMPSLFPHGKERGENLFAQKRRGGEKEGKGDISEHAAIFSPPKDKKRNNGIQFTLPEGREKEKREKKSLLRESEVEKGRKEISGKEKRSKKKQKRKEQQFKKELLRSFFWGKRELDSLVLRRSNKFFL